MEKKVAMRVSRVSIVVNLLLSVLKLLAGILAHSKAMISDAVHSASDVFSTIIVIIGVQISGKSSDDDHQYGHERLECVASIILAMVLGVTGFLIGYSGIRIIVKGNYSNIKMPGELALVAALASIIIKEWMYWYTRAAAKKINSTVLMADAWHHRSDALSSVGALIGIAGAKLGFKILDPIASIVICLFIVKAAYDIFKDAIDKVVDKACDELTRQRISEVILSQEGVLGIDDLRTRLFGSKIFIDVEISVDGNMKLYDSHQIAENVHDEIERVFPECKHCMVHVNPYKEAED